MAIPSASNEAKVESAENRRRHSRYSLVTTITVHIPGSGSVAGSQGTTVEISLGGVSGYLRQEFEAGQKVELEIGLRGGRFKADAVVRHRMGCRYGFQFVEVSSEQCQMINEGCRGLPPYRSSLSAAE